MDHYYIGLLLAIEAASKIGRLWRWTKAQRSGRAIRGGGRRGGMGWYSKPVFMDLMKEKEDVGKGRGGSRKAV